MEQGNKNKINIENIDEFIKDIDSRINCIEEKELEGKDPEEQQKLKEQWKKERLKNTVKLKQQQAVFDNKMSKWNEKQSELMSIDEIKSGIEDMMKELDMKWEEALKATISESLKNKSKEEKEQFIKDFNNRLENIIDK